MSSERNIPMATYRLQLRPGFGFDQAAQVLDYLSALGISHVYFSPYLQAAEGSTHGYDVVDHSQPNVELGGVDGHERLCAALAERNLGHVIDIVPNHMSIASSHNAWWLSVLEHGPASPYAEYFDVDWESSDERQRNKVLMPILGDHYGRVLEAGGIRLLREDGRFFIETSGRKLPLAPLSLPYVLQFALQQYPDDELEFYSDALRALPTTSQNDVDSLLRRTRHFSVVSRLLSRLVEEQPELARALDAAIESINADPDLLDSLLEQQNYRLSYWRSARHDLDYRRFFDINELAALRVDDERVFASTHRLCLQWVQQGKVHGLRIDHPDGLLDPEGYFERLRQQAPQVWIVAEKILHPGETLPESWPIDGTTGYDFMFHAGALFVDPTAEASFTQLYQHFAGEDTEPFEQMIPRIKRMILTDVLGADVMRLARQFLAVCAEDRKHRDYTLDDLREILVEVLSRFPVYRTYLRPGQQATPRDERLIDQALQRASEVKPDTDAALVAFLRSILLGQHTGHAAREAALRFQQLSGPATAKAVEDTAFYRYQRLVCLNEVGSNPGRFGIGASEFHGFCMWAAQHWPSSMLSTSTHDTKRSEDVRMRISLLSQIPQRWNDEVLAWSEMAKDLRQAAGPDGPTEYLLWQTLVGTWPIEPERLIEYMRKAAREAKLHTSWLWVQADYESALEGFCTRVLQHQQLCERIQNFVQELEPLAQRASLSLTLIKLTAPGIPDIYQGNELFCYNLTDPDNRRPVDFERNAQLLRQLPELSADQILARASEGLPKLYVIWKALQLRRDVPHCFGANALHMPLEVHGSAGRHVVAYAREAEVAVVAPTLVANAKWEDTWVHLPHGVWQNCLVDAEPVSGRVELGPALEQFPVMLLKRVSN